MSKMLNFNDNKWLNIIKVRYLKSLISNKEYYMERVNDMNGQIQYWKRSEQHTNTTFARNYCNMMVQMYLHRYQYYINK